MVLFVSVCICLPVLCVCECVCVTLSEVRLGQTALWVTECRGVSVFLCAVASILYKVLSSNLFLFLSDVGMIFESFQWWANSLTRSCIHNFRRNAIQAGLKSGFNPHNDLGDVNHQYYAVQASLPSCLASGYASVCISFWQIVLKMSLIRYVQFSFVISVSVLVLTNTTRLVCYWRKVEKEEVLILLQLKNVSEFMWHWGLWTALIWSISCVIALQA